MESSADTAEALARLKPLAPIARRGLWARIGDEIYLCGTLGSAFDAWQRARAAVSAAEGYFAQLLGLAEVESLMDDLECEARMSLPPTERLLSRRSPGYGEIPLDRSRTILDRLDATRRLGVALTDSLLLVPAKSVTAICAIESQKGGIK